MTDYERRYRELKEELYWKEQEERERSDREQARREQARRERDKRLKHKVTFEASSWSEAFSKNKRRLAQELREEKAMFEKMDEEERKHYGSDNFWYNQIKINEDAEAFMNHELRLAQPIISRLRKFIDSLQQRARKRAYLRVVEKWGSNANTECIECMVDGEPEDLLWW